ncbi:MAG: radical SAM protein [Candidatus Eisenbacteria sp.]|nr:radical SAM protein [Candidatus Eisenbacteria bacterium]
MYTAGSQAALHVCEIYTSIMGESTYAGWPAIIVRLAGCPLRCTWCDSPHAYRNGEEVPLGEILQRIETGGLRLVLLTGGEPLAQAGSRHLVSQLLRLGYKVVIESGGGVSIQGVDPRACIVLDIKCPTSGMQDRQVWENLDCLKPEDEVKFVIASRGDYEWARDFLRRTDLAERQVVHFSPVEPGWEERQADGEREAHAERKTHGDREAGGERKADGKREADAERKPDGELGADGQHEAPGRAGEQSTDELKPRAPASEAGGGGGDRGGLRLAVPTQPPGVTRRALAEWILADRLPVRLNLQLHAWIWGAGTRGV